MFSFALKNLSESNHLSVWAFSLQWETRTGLFAEEHPAWLRTFTTRARLETLKEARFDFFY